MHALSCKGDSYIPSSMQLPGPTLLLREYHDAILAALSNSEVPVYLDTSVLMWCLKVGKEAREEFLQWCQTSLDQRIHIPTWAAHELYRHLRQSTIPTEVKKKAGEFQKGMNNLLKYVSVAADDSLAAEARYATRADLVRDTREHALRIHSTLSALTKDRPQYKGAVASITQFVNERIIQSNVFSVLEIVAGTYEVRFSGRVPPGFKDEAKQENSFGDLIFWRELIEHLKQTESTGAAILITNDNKSDWHHKPRTLVDYDGKDKGEQPYAGFEAKVPHPLLQHEARLAGIQEIFIINLTILSVVLDRLDPTKFGALTAATHPRGIPKHEAGINWKMIHPSQSAGPVTPGSGHSLVVNRVEALTKDDLAAEVSIPDTISPLLLKLTGSLEERSAARQSLLHPDLIPEFSIFTLVEVGRHLYRAAAAFPEESDAFVMDVFRSEIAQDLDQASAIALGMFRELYFDEHFVLRGTPLQGAAEALFSLETDERLQRAVQKIGAMLAPFREKLLYIPSTLRERMDLKLRVSFPADSKAKHLDSAMLNGRELLCDSTSGGSNSLTYLLGSSSGTVQQLISVISRRFFIPYELLSPDKELSSTVAWSEEQGLCLLRTDLGGVVEETTAAFLKG